MIGVFRRFLLHTTRKKPPRKPQNAFETGERRYNRILIFDTSQCRAPCHQCSYLIAFRRLPLPASHHPLFRFKCSKSSTLILRNCHHELLISMPAVANKSSKPSPAVLESAVVDSEARSKYPCTRCLLRLRRACRNWLWKTSIIKPCKSKYQHLECASCTLQQPSSRLRRRR